MLNETFSVIFKHCGHYFKSELIYFSRNSLVSSTLDLEDDLIPTAPPIDASLLETIPLRVYESRTSQILNAKGTLKKKQSTDLQFFLHEHEDFAASEVDSVSLVSEEDFGGIKGHIKNGHMTIRSHRGNVIFDRE